MADDLTNSASPQLITRMLYLINIERQELALPALETSVPLNRAAQAHCDDMAHRHYFDLRTPEGMDVSVWVMRAGYSGRITTHIYRGPTSIAAVNAWMRSASRTAILDPLARHMGIGMAEGVWALIVGDPEHAVSDTTALAAVRDTTSTTAHPALPEAQSAPPAPAGPSLFEQPTAMLSSRPDTLASMPALVLPEGLLSPAPVTEPMPAGPAPDPGPSPSPLTTPLPAMGATAPETAPGMVETHYLGTGATQVGTPVPAAADPPLRVRVLDLLNHERVRAGLTLLSLSEPLSRAAQEHAEDLVRRDYCSPIGPEGEGPDGRAARSGYAGRCGQSVAMGLLTLEAALQSFLGEAVSRASVYNPTYQHLGIGLCRGRWALLFGIPAGAPAEASQSLGLSGRLRDLGARGAALGQSIGGLFVDKSKLPAGSNPQPDMALANKMVALINTERAKLGLHPLSLSEPLTLAAQAHTNDMVARGYFAYTGPDGQGLEAQVQKAAYAGRTGANLSAGQATPDGALKSFLGSDGNRANLQHPDYRHVGVGVLRGHWTLVFGIPQAAQAAAGPEVTARLLELINQERGRVGLSGLALNNLLTKAAQAHSEDMARRGFVGSVSPEGEGVGARVERAGYQWRAVSESTAVDRATPESVVEGWMKIEDHRANVLDRDFRHVGIGLAGGRWTVVFARPQ